MSGPSADREPSPSEHRHAGGRPRLPGTDRAIIKAVAELMTEQGVRGTTINAVADRAGVARGTVYRRWPNRSAMIASAIRASRTLEPLELSDDLERNIRRQAEEARIALAEPSFQAMIPTLAEMQLNGESDDIVRSTIFPRRRQMAEMYERLAAGAGYRTDIPPELPNDLLIGAMLYRLFYDGRPPAAADVQGMVDVILAGIRLHDPRP